MSIRSGLVLSVAALLLAAAGAARAQTIVPLTLTGDVERGKALAYTCTGCHGVDTAVNAYPNYHVPKLGGQNADYIEVALQGYRAGTRPHPTMQAQATQLSDQDIADIAAYLTSEPGEPARGISSAGAAEIAAGQEKSMVCQTCHGANGIAQAPQWPNLAGQHRSYLIEALRQYRNAERTDPVMGPQAMQLDSVTLEQIAAYYAAQPGVYQTAR